MKKMMLCILVYGFSTVYCQNNIGKSIVENNELIPQNGSFLFVHEVAEVFMSDTLIAQRIFSNRVNDKPSIMDDYVVATRKKAFYSQLKVDTNYYSKKMFGNTNMDNLSVKMPSVDWGRVYEGCKTCPFADFSPNSRIYVEFALIYMGEDEIKQMIAYESGEQWKYMLEDIKYGDYFLGITSTNPVCREIDRRIMQFLIDKWSPCQIPEVQELVKVLKESLPLDELVNPVDVIKGTWRGAFGNKTINLTIDYDASIAEAEKAEAIRTRWGMFKYDNFGVLAKSIFDGQPESKAVSSKGYFTDGGMSIRVNLIELPDTAQWNGEFNIWVNRKTNLMRGTWESNNKKLKREFELEKVKE